MAERTRWVSTDEAARLHNVKTKTIDRWRRGGRITGRRRNGGDRGPWEIEVPASLTADESPPATDPDSWAGLREAMEALIAARFGEVVKHLEVQNSRAIRQGWIAVTAPPQSAGPASVLRLHQAGYSLEDAKHDCDAGLVTLKAARLRAKGDRHRMTAAAISRGEGVVRITLRRLALLW